MRSLLVVTLVLVCLFIPFSCANSFTGTRRFAPNLCGSQYESRCASDAYGCFSSFTIRCCNCDPTLCYGCSSSLRCSGSSSGTTCKVHFPIIAVIIPVVFVIIIIAVLIIVFCCACRVAQQQGKGVTSTSTVVITTPGPEAVEMQHPIYVQQPQPLYVEQPQPVYVEQPPQVVYAQPQSQDFQYSDGAGQQASYIHQDQQAYQPTNYYQ